MLIPDKNQNNLAFHGLGWGPVQRDAGVFRHDIKYEIVRFNARVIKMDQKALNAATVWVNFPGIECWSRADLRGTVSGTVCLVLTKMN